MIPNLQTPLIALVIAGLMAAVGFGYGWKERGVRCDAAIATTIATAQTQARETETALNNRAAAAEAAQQLEAANARTAQDAYHRAVRAGSVRLSIPARCPGPSSAASAASGVPEGRAELDPEVAVTLDAIANDGDAAIRKYNSLIDFYNDVRAKLQGSH